MFDIKIGGLEDHIRSVVKEEVARALDARADDPWLTSDEAAAYLGVKVGTIHDLVSAGRLPRHGGRKEKIRLRRSEADAYAEGRANPPTRDSA